MTLYFSFSLNFPTAAQWHNRVFVHCLEELFVNCFASRTASFVCVLPQIQKVPQQRRKLKEKKCNFYSLRISLQMEKFSNCVFQNVLNWELKENSFCSYTGDREKETLKNRTFWERKKKSCLLALVKWQYSTGGKNERGTENFQLNIW